jgi:hypothetical protein
MSAEATTHITEMGTVLIGVSDQDRALEFYVGTRDPDGNRFRMVQRPDAAGT